MPEEIHIDLEQNGLSKTGNNAPCRITAGIHSKSNAQYWLVCALGSGIIGFLLNGAFAIYPTLQNVSLAIFLPTFLFCCWRIFVLEVESCILTENGIELNGKLLKWDNITHASEEKGIYPADSDGPECPYHHVLLVTSRKKKIYLEAHKYDPHVIRENLVKFRPDIWKAEATCLELSLPNVSFTQLATNFLCSALSSMIVSVFLINKDLTASRFEFAYGLGLAGGIISLVASYASRAIFDNMPKAAASTIIIFASTCGTAILYSLLLLFSHLLREQ